MADALTRRTPTDSNHKVAEAPLESVSPNLNSLPLNFGNELLCAETVLRRVL